MNAGGVGAVLRKGGFEFGGVRVVVYARDGEFGVMEYELELKGAAIYESSGDGWIWTVALQAKVDKYGNATCAALVGDGRMVAFRGFAKLAPEFLPLRWGSVRFLDNRNEVSLDQLLGCGNFAFAWRGARGLEEGVSVPGG